MLDNAMLKDIVAKNGDAPPSWCLMGSRRSQARKMLSLESHNPQKCP
jgi:hypothetical protein